MNSSKIPFAEPAFHSLPSPYFNASHIKLQKAVRAWTDEHLMGQVFDWEEEREVDHSKVVEAAKAGILIPLAFGGHIDPKFVDSKDQRGIIAGIKPEEWDGFHDYILIDELMRMGSLGVQMSLFGSLQIGIPPLINYGSDALKAKVLPGLLRGETRICLAITEPEAGSDVRNLSTTAVKSKDGSHYIVNGSKKWITGAVYSDYFTTAVRTSGKPGDADGITLLLVPKSEGTLSRKMKMTGGWSAGTSYLDLEDAKVPVEYRLGEEGKGFQYILSNFNHERLMIAINSNRLARCCIEDALSYAHSRIVFGQKLTDIGVIRNKLAHMARGVEAQTAWIESIIYQLNHMTKAQGDKFLGGTTALLKAHCGITLDLVVREAVQVVGGIGVTRGGRAERIERVYRDTRMITIPGGSEEVLLDLGIRQAIKLSLGLGAKL